VETQAEDNILCTVVCVFTGHCFLIRFSLPWLISPHDTVFSRVVSVCEDFIPVCEDFIPVCEDTDRGKEKTEVKELEVKWSVRTQTMVMVKLP
jgi:hypothetical protein